MTTETTQFTEARERKAEEILKKGKPEIIDEFTYLVPSQNSDKKYRVIHVDGYSCECGDYEKRCQGKGLYCKHVKAILLFEKLKRKCEIVSGAEKNIEYVINPPKKESCPHCKSEQLIKRGLRKTKLGSKQRYSCKECNKRFILDVKKIKGSEKLLALALDCYYKGLSYRDVSDQFSQFYGLEIHHETIRRWVLRFSKVLNENLNEIQPQIKGVWNADETLILTKRGKDGKKPTSNHDYVWNVMDNESKFLLASISSGRKRSSKEAQRVFEEARERNGKMPNQIITDGYRGYEDGCRKAFRNWGNERKVKFTSIKGRRKQVNNNAIESHHVQQKEFHKVRKGVTETQAYQDGYKIFHNFVRKSVKGKTTPAEKCGLTIPHQNRWIGLLREDVTRINQINQKSPDCDG